MNKINNQRGSITLYVLLSMLFFVIVTGAAYISMKNKGTNQDREIARIQKTYEQKVIKPGKVDDRVYTNIFQLPEEYQQIDYIESTGTQYINTNVIPDGNTRIIATYQIVNEGERIDIFGSYGSGTDLGCLQFSYGSTSLVGYGNVVNNSVTSITMNTEIHEIKVDSSKFLVDDQSKYTGTWTETTTAKPLYIFACNANDFIDTTYMGRVRIYSFEIYSGTTLVRNLVPCYFKENNTTGLYDTVEEVFYPNAGTGEFKKGKKVDLGITSAQLNEYEQDGLVMHLDGIINSKNLHSSELSNEWYNIKNEENNATIVNGCIVGKDYVQLGKSGSQYLETGLTVFDKTYTIEMVITPLSFYDYNALWASSGGGTAREGWIYGNGRLVSGRENGVSGNNCVVKTLSVGEKLTATFVANETDFYGYVNGTKKISKTTTIGTETRKLYFNKRSNYGDNKWYSIRVYDRALTDEEVSANYEIDKARFGLK